jgi:hypothetical protein
LIDTEVAPETVQERVEVAPSRMAVGEVEKEEMVGAGAMMETVAVELAVCALILPDASSAHA